MAGATTLIKKEPTVTAPTADSISRVVPVGGGNTGPTPQNPQATPAPGTLGAGTGFVNLDRVIGANTGAAKSVESLVKQGVDKQSNDFRDRQTAYGQNREAARARSAVGGPALNAESANNTLNNGLTTPGGLTTASFGNSFSDFKFDDKLDPSKWDDKKRLDALSDSRTAGRQLASDNGMLSQYGPKLDALNAAIYGSAPNAGAMRNASGAISSERDAENAIARGERESTDGLRSDNAARIKQNADVLRGIGSNITSSLQAKADAANAAAAPYGGPKATIGNFLNETNVDSEDNVTTNRSADALRLDRLSEILGDPALSQRDEGRYRNQGQEDAHVAAAKQGNDARMAAERQAHLDRYGDPSQIANKKHSQGDYVAAMQANGGNPHMNIYNLLGLQDQDKQAAKAEEDYFARRRQIIANEEALRRGK